MLLSACSYDPSVQQTPHSSHGSELAVSWLHVGCRTVTGVRVAPHAWDFM